MSRIEDLEYLRSRAVQEQAAAAASRCGTARVCHEQLAAQYEARAMQLAIGLQFASSAPARIELNRVRA